MMRARDNSFKSSTTNVHLQQIQAYLENELLLLRRRPVLLPVALRVRLRRALIGVISHLIFARHRFAHHISTVHLHMWEARGHVRDCRWSRSSNE